MMPNESNAFLKSTKQEQIVLVDMFLDEGVEGEDVVSGSVLCCKTDLTLAQDFVFTEEVLQSAV